VPEPQKPVPIEPMAQPKNGRAKLIATVGISAAALVSALVAGFEGKRNDPYNDLIAGGIPTVCFGETNVPMRHYSDAECEDMLQSHLADYSAAVLKRNPELRNWPYQLAAAVSLEYNIGAANYARSTVARDFSNGNWTAACDAFLQWKYANGKMVPGLLNRRKAERAVCLKGL
jgi:lysozyme